MDKIKRVFLNLILPGVILSGAIGFIVGFVLFFYKYVWDLIFKNSLYIYEKIRMNLILIIPGLFILIVFAFIQTQIIKRVPESRGGGIPTSEGVVRGQLNCSPTLTCLSTIGLSFISIFVGVPLGSEGPSVLIGTTLSNQLYKFLPKRFKAYKRYMMTGGASTAFAVATGAPITGILFALEEIHRKFSPMILLVSISSVLSGIFIDYALSNKFNVSIAMFENLNMPVVPLNKVFIFAVVGLVIGILAILFSKLIELCKDIFDNKTAKINIFYKILSTFIITFILGLTIKDALGGGHSLIVGLFNDKNYSILMLFLLLGIKFLMIPYASSSGVTGGMFIPILTIGALIGMLLAKAFNMEEYKNVFIAVSMVSFMSAAIGCPLSGIVFACEVLSGLNNILPILISVFIAFAIFKATKFNTVYDIVLEGKLKNKYTFRDFVVVDYTFKVNRDSFACNKSTRDLLLPPNAIILSIQRSKKDHFKMDNLGDKILHENDIITLRAQTYNVDKTENEIEAFFGTQEKLEVEIIQEKKYN